jgi:type II secretory pathway pseudopilin PulG
MVTRCRQTAKSKAGAAFTLVEAVMSIAILALVMAGMIRGYIQTNRRAEWSSMSLAAQSSAVEAIEQVRAAQWAVNGGTATNQLQLLPATYTRTSALLIPSTSQVTNVITTVNISSVSINPPLYQFRAASVWYFPGNTNAFTNYVITWRAPDR